MTFQGVKVWHSSPYAYVSNLASLCSHTTSSSTFKVQFQYSRTQAQRMLKHTRMWSWYRG